MTNDHTNFIKYEITAHIEAMEREIVKEINESH